MAALASHVEDPFRLRELPNEDIFLYTKHIENRVVRQPDPRSGGQCWSYIGAAGVIVTLLGVVLTPMVANTMAGYKIQELKAYEQRLLDDRKVLEVEEAQMLNPARLEELANRQQLATPGTGQVVHLDSNGGALASNLR